jgi:hypothetical protein
MTRKMNQTEERQIPRVMAVAIGNGADHHYEIHDMHLNRVWLEKIKLPEATPFTLQPNEALSIPFWEGVAEHDLGNGLYWRKRA